MRKSYNRIKVTGSPERIGWSRLTLSGTGLPALKESGAWPLASLRQSFLNGSLTRLIDPDSVLRSRIVDFVSRGEFGLASGLKSDGGYERVLFNEYTDPADVTFESGVFLLLKNKAKSLKAMPESRSGTPEPESILTPKPETGSDGLGTEASRQPSRKNIQNIWECAPRNMEPAWDEDSA